MKGGACVGDEKYEASFVIGNRHLAIQNRKTSAPW